jgi:hypothetical protein
MSSLIIDRLDGSNLEKRIHVGDTDTALVLRLFDLSSNAYDPLVDPCPPPLDVSGLVEGVDLLIIFEKPGDAVGDDPIVLAPVPATFATLTIPPLPGQVGGGVDGYIEYRTAIGFLDRAGRWRGQGAITDSPGAWRSEIIEFEVFPILV